MANRMSLVQLVTRPQLLPLVVEPGDSWWVTQQGARWQRWGDGASSGWTSVGNRGEQDRG